MAYIQPRKDKDGNVISYSVRVFKGYAPNGEQQSKTKKPLTNSLWSLRKNAGAGLPQTIARLLLSMRNMCLLSKSVRE